MRTVFLFFNEGFYYEASRDFEDNKASAPVMIYSFTRFDFIDDNSRALKISDKASLNEWRKLLNHQLRPLSKIIRRKHLQISVKEASIHQMIINEISIKSMSKSLSVNIDQVYYYRKCLFKILGCRGIMDFNRLRIRKTFAAWLKRAKIKELVKSYYRR
jgi:DNA-binding CsgD family transcriptional regulator